MRDDTASTFVRRRRRRRKELTNARYKNTKRRGCCTRDAERREEYAISMRDNSFRSRDVIRRSGHLGYDFRESTTRQQLSQPARLKTIREDIRVVNALISRGEITPT